MLARVERTAWVSYLRVSTPDQADRELSLPAQRRAVEDFATRHGAPIAFIAIDEHGTEAAGGVAVVGNAGSGMIPEQHDFIVDRPFLFFP